MLGVKMTTTFRMDAGLVKWLKQQAKKANRSLNAEVEYRLMKQREGEEVKPLLDELRAIVEAARK